MRKYQNQKWSVSKNQRGATAVIVGTSIFALIGIAALVVDLGNIYVARNELHNAADAGALAGARVLYNDTATAINCVDVDGDDSKSANKVAYNVAKANFSQNQSVDVNWTPGSDNTDNINNNNADVQRGHWSFANKQFTPNYSDELIDLWNVTTAELDDADTGFINAVRVVARRQATPVESFFAKIFGHENFEVSAEAVAYIGFAGELAPTDVDQPIAICEDSLLNNDNEYDCTIGRMINSGQDAESNETGGWTSFEQAKIDPDTGDEYDDPCTGGTNAEEVKSLVCKSGNPKTIFLGEPMATNGGDIQSAFNDLILCWENETEKTQPWQLALPVIDCGDANNVGTCEEVVGSVILNVVWITGGGEDPHYNDAPELMTMTDVPLVDDWSISTHASVLLTELGGGYEYEEGKYEVGTTVGDVFNTDGEVRWASFVQHFMLRNDDGTSDGTPAPYVKKSIYFLPDCDVHIPRGTTGGKNFGILAKIPVLVH
jgi:Flp pilus assembly protein TadG